MKTQQQQNMTLVAFYGSKPPGMAQLIETIQDALLEQFSSAYIPFEPGQIHATIIGLEGHRTHNGILNANLLNSGITAGAMDLQGLFRFICETPLLPLQVRLGGFRHSADYPFNSRGQHPYTRSFSCRDGTAVAIGWPMENGMYTMSLDQLRRQCINYNVLHKYHDQAGAIDNDLFLVLGRFNTASVPHDKAELAQHTIRNLMSAVDPVDTWLDQGTLSVVTYRDRSLPIQSSVVYTLDESLHAAESLTTTRGTSD